MEATWRWALVTAVAPVAWAGTSHVTRRFLPAGRPLHRSARRALPAGSPLPAVRRTLPHAPAGPR
ncbi:hypothetical protein OUQ99_12160 [Streptomonospora nanhaiensis]|uniref:Uncharacterized protein n=1 Tax=Streptomonospora nanhaiensis TaxID=1323731 RepID=A0ABY6YUW1_9ACTN|nr:hypothetical protein [Streptomonospora nanhaiensis]WAE75776.1 hypothetical protein OUQ99_12160 [Streptomonospora nanhaiensis]